MASGKKYVIEKGGRFATVAGGLGGRPKVYPTMTAAQYDIDSNVKLKGGLIQVYVPENGPAVAAPPATPAAATTTKAKAATVKQPVKPKKASAGK